MEKISEAFSSSKHENIPYSRPSTPQAHAPQLGFAGLGAMGYFMARNLAQHKQSHPRGANPLLVYNRTRSKCEQLLQELGPEKVKIAESPEELALSCDVIITSLANDAVVKTVYSKFSAALKTVKHDKPKIFVETSTSYPELVGELDKLISHYPHTHLITCPVLGPPIAADKAQLILVMSGDYRSKKEAAYLLVPAVGRKVIDLGGNLEKAPTLKLIGNSIILGAIEVVAESITMGEKAGIDSDVVLGLIKDMFPNTPMANYASKIVNDEFDGTTGFSIDGGLKDAKHILALTSNLNAPMPVVSIAHQNMLTARAIHSTKLTQGRAKFPVLDWSALVAGPRVAAGLDGLDSTKHTRIVVEEEQQE